MQSLPDLRPEKRLPKGNFPEYSWFWVVVSFNAMTKD
jgi:hypothetical protein